MTKGTPVYDAQHSEVMPQVHEIRLRLLYCARSPSFSEPPFSPHHHPAPVTQNGVAEQPGRPLNASGAHQFEPWCAVDVYAPGVALF